MKKNKAPYNGQSTIGLRVYSRKKMQASLDKMGLQLIVRWRPDANSGRHGEIRDNILFIYDLKEEDAWNTFAHEVIEFQLKNVTQPYRILINNLISAFEEVIYQRKEVFIGLLPTSLRIIEEAERAALALDKEPGRK